MGGAGGSVARRSTVAPCRPKKSSTASRTPGRAAKAAPASSSRATKASASERRAIGKARRRRARADGPAAGRPSASGASSRRAITPRARSGVGGQSTWSPSRDSMRSSSGIVRLHLLAQPAQRPGQPRLHGPARAVERRRGLLLGQVEEVAAGDRLAIVLRQLRDGGQQLVAPLEVEERRLG